MDIKKGKVAILLSGRGSNFEAIYNNSLKKDSNFQIEIVVSDKKKARGLELAEKFGIENHYIPPRKFETREHYEKHLIQLFEQKNIGLICLAGFMRIITGILIAGFRNRIMNIHPSLLPAFPGLNAQGQAIGYGAKISGCTVHFVDEGMDTGPIILQKDIKVMDNDDEDSLSIRILKEEHILYSKAIQLYFDQKLKIEGRKVTILP
ncbi:MAG: phosphoribosylglycinamide formyltransferase [Acidobacteriota bacterium]